MNIPLPIRNLANTDRKLLEAVLDSGFDFRQVVTKSPNAHPAQQSLMSFLLWFGQPHIKDATDTLLSLFHRVEHLCTTARQARARTVLEKSLTLIHSITPTSIPTHTDPIQAEKARREAHAIARESRLIAARLTPAGLLKDPDAPPRTTQSRGTQPRTPKLPAAQTASLTNAQLTEAPTAHHTAPLATSATRVTTTSTSTPLAASSSHTPTHSRHRASPESPLPLTPQRRCTPTTSLHAGAGVSPLTSPRAAPSLIAAHQVLSHTGVSASKLDMSDLSPTLASLLTNAESLSTS